MPFCRYPFDVQSHSLVVIGNTATWTIQPSKACDVRFEVNQTCYPSWPGNKDCQVDTVVETASLNAHEIWSVAAQLPNCYQVDGAFDNHDNFLRLVDTGTGGHLPCEEIPATTTTSPSTTTSTTAQPTTTTTERPTTTTTTSPQSTTTVQGGTSPTVTPQASSMAIVAAPVATLPETGFSSGDLTAIGLATVVVGVVMREKGRRLIRRFR